MFAAVFGVTQTGALQHIGGKLTIEQVTGRSAAVAVPAVPEVKSQTGKAFGPAGLPATEERFGPNTVLLEIEDFLDVAPGIITGPHQLEKGFVIGVVLSDSVQCLVVEGQVFTVGKEDFGFHHALLFR